MHRFLLFFVLAGILRGMVAQAGVIEGLSFPDTAAARAVWKPIGGSPAVELAQAAGRRALRMPCPFGSQSIERGCWDLPVQLNLAYSRGVQLEILCNRANPVSYFSLYLRSGAGWYHFSFFPEDPSGWNSVLLEKSNSTIEGTPAGWSQIDGVRISAWRGQNTDTEFYLGGIRTVGELGVDSRIAILRADSKTTDAEREQVEQISRRVFRLLTELGIECTLLSDVDTTPEHLKQSKLVVLPHNPGMPAEVAEHLADYARQGGKILAFYTLPQQLHAVLGISGGRHLRAPTNGAFAQIAFQPGSLSGAPNVVTQQSWNIMTYQPVPGRAQVVAEWLDTSGERSGYPAMIGSSNALVMTHVLLPEDGANKQQMLLAMVGRLLPETWPRVAQGAVDSIGRVGEFSSFDEVAGALRRARSERVRTALDQAIQLKKSAERALGARRFPEALDRAREAKTQLLQAYCSAQAPLAGEFRGFWCHSAYGVAGMNWDAAVKRLADNGFTAIFPNMLWGGVAYYPSDTLPEARALPQRGDQIAECLAAAKRHNVQVHVWKVNWNLGSGAPKQFVEQMRREKRLQVSAEGKEETWLCPSHPLNQNLEIASMVEVARKYPVSGLHFDYIRYPGGDYCFCSGCKQRFERVQGKAVADWPLDVLKNGTSRAEWLDWRRSHITRVVRETSQQARAVRPGIQLSAAVFRNWANDRDSVAQDWKLWCDEGYVDFVCPMDYTESHRSFENMVSQQIQWAGKARCYPGIGASTASSQFGAEGVLSQIKITRKHQTGGFLIFNYGVDEAQGLVPLLGSGITRASPR